jgi:hypothetical protein
VVDERFNTRQTDDVSINWSPRRSTTYDKWRSTDIRNHVQLNLYTNKRQRTTKKQNHKGPKNGQRRGLSPKDPGHFLRKPLKDVGTALIPLTPLTLVLMVFWPGTVDAESRLWRAAETDSLSFSLSLTLPLSHTFTCLFHSSYSIYSLLSSILYPFSPLLYSLSIRSVITGHCQHLKTIVLAEPVSSQVELTIFPVPD